MNIDHPNLSFNIRYTINETFLVYIDQFSNLKFLKNFKKLLKNDTFDVYSKKYKKIETSLINKKSTKKYYDELYNYLINCKASKVLVLNEGVCILLEDNSLIIISDKARLQDYGKFYVKYVNFLINLENVKDVLGGWNSMHVITLNGTIIYYDSDDHVGSFSDNLHVSDTFNDIKAVKYDENVGFTILHNNSTFSCYIPDSKHTNLKMTLNSLINITDKQILDWLVNKDIIFIFYSDNSYILYNIDLETSEVNINKTLTITEETDDEIYISFYDISDTYLNSIILVKNFQIIACNYFNESTESDVLFCTLYKTKNINNIPLNEDILATFIPILEPLDYKYLFLTDYILIIILSDNTLRLYNKDAVKGAIPQYNADVNAFDKANSQCFVRDLHSIGSYI